MEQQYLEEGEGDQLPVLQRISFPNYKPWCGIVAFVGTPEDVK